MLHQSPRYDRDIISLLGDISRTMRCCQQEEVFCENVTFTQFFILDAVAERKKLRLADLHTILSVDKSTTTRLVNPLVKRGLVKRRKTDHDSRAVELTLTPEGEDVHRKVWECLASFVDAVHEGIPDGKRAEVFDAIRIFLRAVGNACSGGQCCS
jgi:DNA-binding MarR family transcriptional regulator